MNVNFENFPSYSINSEEQSFCERASCSLEITIRSFLSGPKLYRTRKTELLSKTLYFVSTNIFSSLYNLQNEIAELLCENSYFSMIFTICCLFLYYNNVSISPLELSNDFLKHNYNIKNNFESFLDNIIEQFSDKTTKKYQLTRIWDILDIFRNLELGVPVPVLVNDAIYLDDSNESTNRYVLLVGIDKEFAIVLDSEFAKNNFVYYCPIEQFLNSIISSQNLTCAWDFRNLFLD